MTAYQCLAHWRERTALQIAAETGIALEYVYLDLVAAEARGMACVRVYEQGGKFLRTWVAL